MDMFSNQIADAGALVEDGFSLLQHCNCTKLLRACTRLHVKLAIEMSL